MPQYIDKQDQNTCIINWSDWKDTIISTCTNSAGMDRRECLGSSTLNVYHKRAAHQYIQFFTDIYMSK